jgi:ketosteroid isomerase-like protein
MKPTPLLCLVAAFIFSLVPLARAASQEDTIAAVLAAHQARSTALVAHDIPALERLLAPDFNYTHSNNMQETKASHIDSLVQGLRYAKYETSELRVNVITPDVVTINGIFTHIKGKDGAMKEGRYLFLAVWRKHGDAWQLTSFQSALPPVPAAK